MQTGRDTGTIRAAVESRYAAAARAVLDKQPASCCGPASGTGCCGSEAVVSGIGCAGYDAAAVAELPIDALQASLGCGNPTALAQLQAGQVVLDLGSGGGLDVLLSARLVGPEGFVYGLDMTDEMLELARKNQRQADLPNVEFLKGEIESIPLPDESVDVIISNCVINLSADKEAVFREAFRVLRPGGLFAVSDIVAQGEISPAIRANLDAWSDCVAGALEQRVYLEKLAAAGFEQAGIEITQVHDLAPGGGCCETAVSETSGSDESGRIASGFVRARKR